MLSGKALNVLAEKIAPTVSEELFADPRIIELMHEIVPDIVTRELGEMDEDMLFELSLIVMDKIYCGVA